MRFRKVTAILRPERLEAVEEVLKKLNVPGVSVTKVKGFGEYANFYQSDWLCTHVRIEVFIGTIQAEKIAQAIMDVAHTGMEGDGIVAVLPVESVYHIRTKEKCEYEACK
ncbi:MAG TPA: P-II family nitrogen regulator [Gammaproteobacteria bacterium]|nr:P-II family nitrogen regulator [Gammaproteobacteria bacterium]